MNDYLKDITNEEIVEMLNMWIGERIKERDEEIRRKKNVSFVSQWNNKKDLLDLEIVYEDKDGKEKRVFFLLTREKIEKIVKDWQETEETEEGINKVKMYLRRRVKDIKIEEWYDGNKWVKNSGMSELEWKQANCYSINELHGVSTFGVDTILIKEQNAARKVKLVFSQYDDETLRSTPWVSVDMEELRLKGVIEQLQEALKNIRK